MESVSTRPSHLSDEKTATTYSYGEVLMSLGSRRTPKPPTRTHYERTEAQFI